MRKLLESLARWPDHWFQCLFMAAALVAAYQHAEAQTKDPAIEAAEASAAQFTPNFNSKSSVKKNAIDPLQGRTQMTAQDGTQFNASIQCASAKQLVNVFAAPSGSGDLQTLLIAADMDLDGNMDTSLSTTLPISGVCSNGLISCDAGTWNNCQPLRWNATATNIALENVNMENLAGCYCINNSCGSSLVWTNIGIITRDIGTGLVQAIQQQHPDYVISSVNVDSSNAEFYGATGAGCRTGTTGQTEYLKNPASLITGVNNEVSIQTTQPESLYNTVTGSIATQTTTMTSNSCTIKRVVDVTSDTCQLLPDAIQNSCVNIENDPKCRLREEVVDGVTTYENYTPTNLVPLESTRTIGSASGYITYESDVTEVLVLKIVNGIRGLYYEGTENEHPDYELYTYQVKIKIDNEFIYIWVEGLRIGLTDYEEIYSIVAPPGEITISYDALGKPLLANIRSGAPTPELVGIVYDLPSRITLNGRKIVTIPCNHNVTRPWWNKQRIYMCDTAPTTFDFTDAKIRSDRATSQASLEQGFKNATKDAAGNWSEENIGLGSPQDMPVVADCQPVCKVFKVVQDDRVTPDATTSQVKVTPTRKVYRYPSCANNQCPLEAGETIEKDCQCLNDFAEAATIMQSIRFAGQDILCSP